MICLKNLAMKYNMAIVTSIHQPNSDIIMLFDKLYVLSKGGKCVFDGETNELKMNLQECQIDCQEWQVPVEELIRVASQTHKVSIFNFFVTLKINKINIIIRKIIMMIKLTT